MTTTCDIDLKDWAKALDLMGLSDQDHDFQTGLIQRLIKDDICPDSIEDQYQGQVEGFNHEIAGMHYAQDLAIELGMEQFPDWPLTCIDWGDAWHELVRGDGYRLHHIGGSDWLVFRAI